MLGRLSRNRGRRKRRGKSKSSERSSECNE